MNYDKILEHLGEKGRWNVLNMLLLSLPGTVAGGFVIIYSFTGTQTAILSIVMVKNCYSTGFQPMSRCKIEGCDLGPNPSFYDFNETGFSFETNDKGEKVFDYCSHFPVDNSTWINKDNEFCSASDFNSNGPMIECDQYIYEEFEMKNSIVTDFDLVCDKTFIVSAEREVG